MFGTIKETALHKSLPCLVKAGNRPLCYELLEGREWVLFDFYFRNTESAIWHIQATSKYLLNN